MNNEYQDIFQRLIKLAGGIEIKCEQCELLGYPDYVYFVQTKIGVLSLMQICFRDGESITSKIYADPAQKILETCINNNAEIGYFTYDENYMNHKNVPFAYLSFHLICPAAKSLEEIKIWLDLHENE